MKRASEIVPIGPEPNRQVEQRVFTDWEIEVFRVMTTPEFFNLTLEDKRRKTYWRGNRGPIGKKRFMQIVRDPWFIQQYRDTLLLQMGERLGEVLDAMVENSTKPTGHSDRKMLLQILGIHRDQKEQHVTGRVDHVIDRSDRLKMAIERAMQQPNADLLPATTEVSDGVVLNGEAVEVEDQEPDITEPKPPENSGLAEEAEAT